MAESTGIILAAGSITLGNEWLNMKGTDYSHLFKIGIATLGAAAVFAGLEKVSEPAAVGIAVIALITVLVGGVTAGVPSPVSQIVSFMGYGPQVKGKK